MIEKQYLGYTNLMKVGEGSMRVDTDKPRVRLGDISIKADGPILTSFKSKWKSKGKIKFGSKYVRVGALVDIEPEQKIKFGKASGEAMRMYSKSGHLILDNRVMRAIKLMSGFNPHPIGNQYTALPSLTLHGVKIV